MPEQTTLPGFVNAHTHTFQRALRGRAGGGDFWTWRELMLAEADRQTPETVRELYTAGYAEMRNAGYTAVGEFHYLGLDEARAAGGAAAAARGGVGPPPGAFGAGGAAAGPGAAPPPPRWGPARASGWRSSDATRRRSVCLCTSTRASSRGRSR